MYIAKHDSQLSFRTTIRIVEVVQLIFSSKNCVHNMTRLFNMLRVSSILIDICILYILPG